MFSKEVALEGGSGSNRATILFDGVCNLCNATVNFVIDRDPRGVFQFAALQSEAGQHLAEHHAIEVRQPESIVLIENGRVMTRSSAALNIARQLSGGWRILYVLHVLPRFVRDATYDFIARRRYRWFVRRDSCRVPTPELLDRFL